MIIAVLKKINRFIRRLIVIARRLPEIPQLSSDPDSQTYYPEEDRKGRVRIYLDNLWWLIRHGEINDFYYLYGLDRKSGTNLGDYMDYQTFKQLRNRYNRSKQFGHYSADYTCLLKDKFVFTTFLKSLGFPTPNLLALCCEGTLYWMDSRQPDDPGAIKKLDDCELFCKTLLGECADGVFPLEIREGQIYIEGKESSMDELMSRTDGSFILQEKVIQHPEMSRLFPHSVNTMRIVTFHTGKGIKIFRAILRAGTGDSTSDNWAIGGVLGYINPETGKLEEKFMYKPSYGGFCRKHPDTGIVFSEFDIPFVMEALEMTRRLHIFMYGIKSIGWDVAITEEGPVVIEANDNWEINTHQKDGGLSDSLPGVFEE